MIQIVENFRFNNDQTVKWGGAEFLVEQRNAGFVDNDGQWIVSLLPELFWSFGELHTRRPGAFLGVFPTTDAAAVAIRDAQIPRGYAVSQPVR